MRIPPNLLDKYTMGGAVAVHYLYCDNTKSSPTSYNKAIVDSTIEKVLAHQCGEYGAVDLWIYDAIAKYPVTGKRVAIIGSADQGHGPWYEAVCLAYGGSPTTVEYNEIEFGDLRLTAIHPVQLENHGMQFDAAFSFSSFEHDGLGRYGDPINPDGDLEAMALWRSYLKPGGLMYLTVPIGADKVVFNAHRIYGRARLPELIKNWQVVDTFGFEERLFDRDTQLGWRPTKADGTLMHPEYPEYAPVFVLRNTQSL